MATNTVDQEYAEIHEAWEELKEIFKDAERYSVDNKRQ